MSPLMTLGLEGEALTPAQDSQESENLTSGRRKRLRAWDMLDLDVDGLGEILFEPRVLLFLAIVALACVVVFLLVSGVVALAQEVLSGGGPPQTLGLGS